MAGPRFVSNYTAVAARHEGIYVGLHDEGVYDADANHEVEISGWGVSKAGGLPYWVLRNSWGAAWGDKVRLTLTPTPTPAPAPTLTMTLILTLNPYPYPTP